jgi:membrane protease YdiL (CAAX protease family)
MIFAGTTLGLYSFFVRQSRRQIITLPALESLRQRPFPPDSIIPIMAITLLFALLAVAQGVQSHPQQASAVAMLKGAALYGLILLTTVLGCMSYAKTGFRSAFGNPSVPWHVALLKGFRYGIEIIPAILVVTMIVAVIGEALGFDMRGQPIFECLDDATVPGWVRAALVFFAVGVAPVVEELLFRGLLLPLVLQGRAFLFGALLTSLYFSLIHLHAPSLLPLLVLSVGFSAGYASTGSILTPIAMHMVFNFTGLLLFFSEIK